MIDSLTIRLCETLPSIVFFVDPDGRVRLCNRRAARVLEISVAEIAGRSLLEFVSGDPEPVVAYLQRCARTGSPLPGALPLATPSGPVTLRARGAALRSEKGEMVIFLQCEEKHQASQLFLELNARLSRLTDELHRRRRLHSSLQRALDEREVLLKEVHHRVRNNLQVITSFLSLQARETDSEMARLALREAQARIRTLGVIHGQLYAQDDLGEVDFSQLVPALCAQLMTVYGVAQEQIRFATVLPRWPIDLERAVPLALLITEALTNALKHAFPGGRTGTVRVELEAHGPVSILRIADDGVGLPSGRPPAWTGSLGMRLMRALAEQIGGALETRSDSGVEVVVTLPAA